MFRQNHKEQKTSLIRHNFLQVGAQLHNIQYLDMVKALELMKCLGHSYQADMREESIRNLTELWERVSLNNQVVVTLGDVTDIIVDEDTNQYDWIFEHVIPNRIPLRPVSNHRNRCNDTQRTSASNKENVNLENIYVRKRVQKICSQFKSRITYKTTSLSQPRVPPFKYPYH